MNTLGNRLEIVEQLAEEKRIDIDYNQKPTHNVANLNINEDDVWLLCFFSLYVMWMLFEKIVRISSNNV